MLRLLLCAAALLLLVAVPSASAAGAPEAVRCASADLRYPFQDGLPNDFGVWRLKVTRGTCATARRVARTWQRRFEQSPSARLPRTVRGFRFRELPPNAAQTYRLLGRRGATVVRFDYVVPNG
jgi:hypothetical protein